MSQHLNHTIDKIYSLSRLQRTLKVWRLKDEKIVFTNGCFDILHKGHLELLASCKSEKSRVVVGLNSDASVKRLKGEQRPINNENDRALHLAALSSVDAVVLFEEDTPENLIKEVKPDELVKGGDYDINTVVGAAFVKSYGGVLTRFNTIEGYSTTNIIKKLREEN